MNEALVKGSGLLVFLTAGVLFSALAGWRRDVTQKFGGGDDEPLTKRSTNAIQGYTLTTSPPRIYTVGERRVNKTIVCTHRYIHVTHVRWLHVPSYWRLGT